MAGHLSRLRGHCRPRGKHRGKTSTVFEEMEDCSEEIRWTYCPPPRQGIPPTGGDGPVRDRRDTGTGRTTGRPYREWESLPFQASCQGPRAAARAEERDWLHAGGFFQQHIGDSARWSMRVLRTGHAAPVRVNVFTSRTTSTYGGTLYHHSTDRWKIHHVAGKTQRGS